MQSIRMKEKRIFQNGTNNTKTTTPEFKLTANVVYFDDYLFEKKFNDFSSSGLFYFCTKSKKAKMVSSSADRKFSRVQKFSALATGGVLSKEGIQTFFVRSLITPNVDPFDTYSAGNTKERNKLFKQI